MKFFNQSLSLKDIQIFEDESVGLEYDEMPEERIMNIREEAMKRATGLREIFKLFKKGSAAS